MSSGEDWRLALDATGELTPTVVDSLLSEHGGRGRRAVAAVSESRVKQYLDFTVVVGHEDEYLVEQGGCTCKDAMFNLDPTDPTQKCWHVLAVEIAERIGKVDHHDLWYADVSNFL